MTDMHPKVFEYLSPADPQLAAMEELRAAAKAYADKIEDIVPDGPDRTYLMRKLREVQMWANVAITRQPDGAPR
jgi:hypothetical protein